MKFDRRRGRFLTNSATLSGEAYWHFTLGVRIPLARLEASPFAPSVGASGSDVTLPMPLSVLSVAGLQPALQSSFGALINVSWVELETPDANVTVLMPLTQLAVTGLQPLVAAPVTGSALLTEGDDRILTESGDVITVDTAASVLLTEAENRILTESDNLLSVD